MLTLQTSQPEPMICATCVYLSDGFRCQRITSRAYAMKISEPEIFGCSRWELHWASKRGRIRDG